MSNRISMDLNILMLFHSHYFTPHLLAYYSAYSHVFTRASRSRL
jgi:hypothetical protein